MNAQHSSASVEHYTPPEILEIARRLMGTIDLDPASCAEANQIVEATKYFTQMDDGLLQQWHGRVWLNPPGGKTKNRSNAAIWWEKLVEEYLAERVTQALFMGFSLEILATSQDADSWVGDFPFFIPRNRISYIAPGGQPGRSPTHSNVLVYLPPKSEFWAPDNSVLCDATAHIAGRWVNP